MNPAMWKKALRVIPSVSKEQWSTLDLVSRWLISSRAAVLVMTFTSAAIAGLFALRDGGFRILPWLFMTLGLMLGHASNNLFNDYTDFVRGVDKDNYFRTMYGPQPVAHGLMTTRQLLVFFASTFALVIACVILVFALDNWDPVILLLFAIGAAFVLLYTWPLKYIGMGEISVLAVWGPLMIGGGYYVLTRHWSWQVIWGSAPYVLGVTTVILGKHIDKVGMDLQKRIMTLPALIGEAAARYLVIAFLIAPYILIAYLVAARYFTPVLAIVLLAVPALVQAAAGVLQTETRDAARGFPRGGGRLAPVLRAEGIRVHALFRHVVHGGARRGGCPSAPRSGILAMSARRRHTARGQLPSVGKGRPTTRAARSSGSRSVSAASGSAPSASRVLLMKLRAVAASTTSRISSSDRPMARRPSKSAPVILLGSRITFRANSMSATSSAGRPAE